MKSWFRAKDRSEPAKIQHKKMCMVYLPLKGENAVIVTYNQNGDGGFYYERGEQLEQCRAADQNQLGEIVKKQFDLSEQKALPESGDKYPKYLLKATKLRSQRQFDRQYLQYQIVGANSANIIMIFKSPKVPNKRVSITASCNSFSEIDIGSTLVEVHNFYLQSLPADSPNDSRANHLREKMA